MKTIQARSKFLTAQKTGSKYFSNFPKSRNKKNINSRQAHKALNRQSSEESHTFLSLLSKIAKTIKQTLETSKTQEEESPEDKSKIVKAKKVIHTLKKAHNLLSKAKKRLFKSGVNFE